MIKEASNESLWLLFEIFITISVFIILNVLTLYKLDPESFKQFNFIAALLFNYILTVVFIKYLFLFAASIIVVLFPKSKILKKQIYKLAEYIEKMKKVVRVSKKVRKRKKEKVLEQGSSENNL